MSRFIYSFSDDKFLPVTNFTWYLKSIMVYDKKNKNKTTTQLEYLKWNLKQIINKYSVQMLKSI